MQNLAVIILAAGKGKRMKSTLPKVIMPIAGKSMIFYLVHNAQKLRASRIVIVVGHKEHLVRESAGSIKGVTFAVQKEQLGTGHAVLCAKRVLKNFSGSVMILSGDVPLLSMETLRQFVALHRRRGATLSLMTAVFEKSHGYGRVIRDDSGRVWKIVEETDATASEKAIKEINAGVYLVDAEFLFRALKNTLKDNKQGEYYLPHILNYAYSAGEKIFALPIQKHEEIRGVNTRLELAEADRIMRKRLIERYAMNGVTFLNPDSTYIDFDVRIKPDCIIYPNTFMLGNTTVGSGCIIEQGATIINSHLGKNVRVKSYSVIRDSVIKSGAQIGPFAHLRPNSTVGEDSRIGNFVELKNTVIGKNTKASHLSYLGDAEIGRNVNIGCGTITCNYDGFKKHKTSIANGVFVGSDTQFVAPVKIGKNAYIGAGSTITKDVSAGSLGISRARQSNIPGFYKRFITRKGER
ncbi:MAG TPA: bifunctional UDP-N-acetylglucosamine diphosphorylase/glucosamine-1-phosphate N-acetyltransferase GlmU [bacterium]